MGLCAVAVVAICVWVLRPAPLDARVYEYGIRRGREDARSTVHRPEEVEDPQIAIQYLSIAPKQRDGRPERAAQLLIKEVFDARETEQKRALSEFARGYRVGYRSVNP